MPEKLPPPSRRKDRKCAECPTMIRRDNKSGLCAPCVKKSDLFRQRSSEAAHRRYTDPEERERISASMRRAYRSDPTLNERKAAKMREIAADPEWKARAAKLCKDRKLWEKGTKARTPQTHKKAGMTFSRRYGIASWCPEDYLDLAREVRKSGVSMEETKRIVFDQRDRDLGRLRRRMGQVGG